MATALIEEAKSFKLEVKSKNTFFNFTSSAIFNPLNKYFNI